MGPSEFDRTRSNFNEIAQGSVRQDSRSSGALPHQLRSVRAAWVMPRPPTPPLNEPTTHQISRLTEHQQTPSQR